MTDTTKKTIPIYNDDIGRAYRNGYEKGKQQGRKEMADERMLQ